MLQGPLANIHNGFYLRGLQAGNEDLNGQAFLAEGEKSAVHGDKGRCSGFDGVSWILCKWCSVFAPKCLIARPDPSVVFTLNASGKMIGIISHVEALKERIPAQIRVEKGGGIGYSRLVV